MGLFTPIQSLLGLANSWASNQTLNGTNNTAPNQTAASSSSLMTQGLVNQLLYTPQQVALSSDVTTSPNSNSQTDISGLVISSVPAGTYLWEAWIIILSSTYATTGSSGRVFFTGTVSSSNKKIIYYSNSSATTLLNSTGTLQDALTYNAILAYPSRSIGFFDSGVLVASSSGNFSLQMAQQTAGAGNITAKAGAYLKIQKIA